MATKTPRKTSAPRAPHFGQRRSPKTSKTPVILPMPRPMARPDVRETGLTRIKFGEHRYWVRYWSARDWDAIAPDIRPAETIVGECGGRFSFEPYVDEAAGAREAELRVAVDAFISDVSAGFRTLADATTAGTRGHYQELADTLRGLALKRVSSPGEADEARTLIRAVKARCDAQARGLAIVG